MRTMRAGSGGVPKGIGELFAGRAVVPLLRLFFLYPTQTFYQRELSDLTGERLFLIQRSLGRLVRAGVVDSSRRGNRIYYRANESHPAFQDLKAVILKTVGVGDVLQAQLAGLGDKVEVAFVYGSVARGEETSTSDLDIMIVGDLSSREVASILAPMKKTLSREINPSVYSPQQFRKGIKARHPFLTAVLKGPKIFLRGDDRGLEAVLGGRAA
jgi:predicted nucleotidyltransferase